MHKDIISTYIAQAPQIRKRPIKMWLDNNSQKSKNGIELFGFRSGFGAQHLFIYFTAFLLNVKLGNKHF